MQLRFYDEHIIAWYHHVKIYGTIILPDGSKVTRAYKSISEMIRD